MKILRRAGLEPAIFGCHCKDCPATLGSSQNAGSLAVKVVHMLMLF